jgi:multidrug resistance efflux pump
MNLAIRTEPDPTSSPLLSLEAAVAVITLKKIDEPLLHSEPVQEVLGVRPNWLVRWGIAVIFFVLTLLTVLSWIIQYPDVISANIVVTTRIPPSGVVARATGELMDIRVRGNEHVDRGALLAVIRNSAEPLAVFQLEEDLSRLGRDPNQPVLSLDLPENLPLGELQSDYSTFVKNYRALHYYVERDPANEEIRGLEPQLRHQRERLEAYLRQRDILAQDIRLVERDYARTLELSARQVLSIKNLEDKQRELLQARRSGEGAELDIANTRLDIDKLDQNLTQLRLRDSQQRQDLQLALGESYKNLRSRLAVWEQIYVLRAPMSGQVSLYKFWSDRQFVKAGDEVVAIVPAGIQPPVGKVTIPLASSGKVRPGQAVYIRLDNYPYQEYGLLKGTVTSISPVPREAHYAIEVELPETLNTTFGKRLDFRQEMQGRAEIVTEDLRLLERIFYQIRKLLTGDAGHRAIPRSTD